MAECRKHDLIDPKCSKLGWKCTPLAVETYGCWSAEARETLSRLATRLAIPIRCTKSQATAYIYGKLSLTLVRSCARALLSIAGPSLVITAWLIVFYFVCCFLCVNTCTLSIISISNLIFFFKYQQYRHKQLLLIQLE